MPPTHPFNEYPKHMYRDASKPPASERLTPAEIQTLTRVGYPGSAVIVHSREEEGLAYLAGYGEKYIHQEYPKVVNGRTVNNAEEEATLTGEKSGGESPDA